MRLKKPMIALSTAALLALAACGGGGGGAPGTGSDTNETVAGNTGGGTAGQGQDPNRQAPAPPIEGAQEGGTLFISNYTGLTTMDPSEAYYTDPLSLLSGFVTRSLTQFVWDDASNGVILVPDLATDLGTPNADFTEWKFTIRDGVKFENGDPVTADDIAYGIKRSFDRETFPTGPTYSNDFFFDGDKYKGPYKSGLKYDGLVVDGNTITIKMSQPFPDMPYWGSFPAMGPIPPGAASDPSKYKLHPLASGPYKFEDYTPNKSLTLVRNDQWDPNTDPGRHQYVDKIVASFDTPQAKTEQTLLSDNGDAKSTITTDNVTAGNYTPFKNKFPDHIVTGPEACTSMWAMDLRKIKDIKIRQALAWAYPYQDVLIAGGYIPNVTRIFGTNIEPPGVPGREDYNPLPGHELGQTDPAKAKALLQQADAVGFEVKFLYATDDPLSVAAKDQIVKGLEAAGFKATPVATTYAQIPVKRADPDFDLTVRSAAWCSDWPSGSTWIPPMFQSTDIAKVGFGAFNYSTLNEPSVDKRIHEIYALPLDKQGTAWAQLEQTIMTKWFPVFVTGYYGGAMLRGSDVMNMHVDSVLASPTYKDMWIKQ
jgi:peptide/nickel transport system substrate-binding protein